MCVDQQVLIMCVLIVLLRHGKGKKKGKQTFYIWKIKVNYTLGKKIYTQYKSTFFVPCATPLSLVPYTYIIYFFMFRVYC
jgi:hypothetical protein